MRRVTFEKDAFNDLDEWGRTDKKIFGKIMDIIRDIQRQPFTGLGKPEALKGNYKGCWSRRINEKDRLIYTVEPDAVIIVSCRGHYD